MANTSHLWRYQIKLIEDKNMDNFVEKIVKERKERVQAVQAVEKRKMEKELIETGKTSTRDKDLVELFKGNKHFSITFVNSQLVEDKNELIYYIVFINNQA